MQPGSGALVLGYKQGQGGRHDRRVARENVAIHPGVVFYRVSGLGCLGFRVWSRTLGFRALQVTAETMKPNLKPKISGNEPLYPHGALSLTLIQPVKNLPESETSKRPSRLPDKPLAVKPSRHLIAKKNTMVMPTKLPGR